MIKLVYTITRKSSLSPEQFGDRWLNVHGPIVKQYAAAIRAKKYVQSHSLQTPLNAQLGESRGMEPGYDGITEIWWDSIEDMLEGGATPEGIAAGENLLADEKEFIDFKHSNIFVTEEHVIFDN